MRRRGREASRKVPYGEHPDAAQGWTQAAIDEAREGRVAARPLLENSTACRKSVPSNKPPMPGPSGSGWGFLWLIDIKSASSWFSAAIKSSTESLILAQDERWRRA